MSQAFDDFSGLTYAKKALERSFQNFTGQTLDSVPGLTLHGHPRLHWDFSRVVPKIDSAFGELTSVCGGRLGRSFPRMRARLEGGSDVGFIYQVKCYFITFLDKYFSTNLGFWLPRCDF